MPGEKRPEKPRRRAGAQRGAIAVGTFVALALIVTPSQLLRRPRLVEGATAKHDIVAPFKFAVEKDRGDLRREQEEAAARILPVFRLNANMAGIAQDELRDFFVILGQLGDTYKAKQGREREAFLDELTIQVTRPVLIYLLETPDLEKARDRAAEVLAQVMAEGVVDADEAERRELGKTLTVDRGEEGGERIVSVDDLLEAGTAVRRVPFETSGGSRRGARGAARHDRQGVAGPFRNGPRPCAGSRTVDPVAGPQGRTVQDRGRARCPQDGRPGVAPEEGQRPPEQGD